MSGSMSLCSGVFRYANRVKDPAAFNTTELSDAILAYDAAWAAYRACKSHTITLYGAV